MRQERVQSRLGVELLPEFSLDSIPASVHLNGLWYGNESRRPPGFVHRSRWRGSAVGKSHWRCRPTSSDVIARFTAPTPEVCSCAPQGIVDELSRSSSCWWSL